jgi:hypothetical protein
MIVDAVKINAEWVFPGADRHRPLVEKEVADRLAALSWAEPTRKAR